MSKRTGDFGRTGSAKRVQRHLGYDASSPPGSTQISLDVQNPHIQPEYMTPSHIRFDDDGDIVPGAPYLRGRMSDIRERIHAPRRLTTPSARRRQQRQQRQQQRMPGPAPSAWKLASKKKKRRIVQEIELTPQQRLARYGTYKAGLGVGPHLTTPQLEERVRDNYWGNGGYRRKRRRKRRGGGYYGSGLYQARGRGGFWGDAWKAIRTPLLDVGTAALGAVPVFGGTLAGLSRQARAHYGTGSYGIASNDLMKMQRPGDWKPPQFTTPSDTGSMTISHKDIIGTVYAPPDSGFSIQEFDINPGLERTFPWLAQIAANFEEYQLVQCIFSYESLVSDFRTDTGVTGQLCAVVKFDPHGRDPENFTEMQSTNGMATAIATKHMEIGVECDPNKLSGSPNKYIRSSGLDKDRDVKDFDHGKFMLGFKAFPPQLQNQSIGLLHVSYTVRVRRPNITTGRGLAISRDQHIQAKNVSDDDYTDFTAIRFTDAARHASGLATKLLNLNDVGIQFHNGKNSIKVDISEAPAKQAVSTDLAFMGSSLPFFQWVANSTLAYLGAPLVGDEQPLLNATMSCKGMKITFPARFSGDVRVKLRLTLDNPVAQCAVSVDKTGNVKKVNDMVTGYHACSVSYDPAASWNGECMLAKRGRNTSTCLTTSNSSHAVEDPTAAAHDIFGCVDVELHIGLTEASGGTDNSVSLYLLTNNVGTLTHTNIINSELIVEEYNAGYTDSRDVPTIENVQTGTALLQDREFNDQ